MRDSNATVVSYAPVELYEHSPMRQKVLRVRVVVIVVVGGRTKVTVAGGKVSVC